MSIENFINYHPVTGVSINTYREPGGYFNDDVCGLVSDMVSEQPGCCPLEGSREALEDGGLWEDYEQAIIEHLHGFITEWEKNQ